MAQENKRGDARDDAQTDEATLVKKRARRRLIGAAALALLAAIVLPMVMDHQPAPPLKDIQVRIPSPDEGAVQRVAQPHAPVKPIAVPVAPDREAAEPARPITKAETKPEAKPEPRSEPKTEEKTGQKPVTQVEPKGDHRATDKPVAKDESRARDALSGKVTVESWEVQLGAYQNPVSVNNLVSKLKQLGLPTYTEKIDTAKGPRTRVRVGPYPSREEAEQARARVKIVGVDGPVARKP